MAPIFRLCACQSGWWHAHALAAGAASGHKCMAGALLQAIVACEGGDMHCSVLSRVATACMVAVLRCKDQGGQAVCVAYDVYVLLPFWPADGANLPARNSLFDDMVYKWARVLASGSMYGRSDLAIIGTQSLCLFCVCHLKATDQSVCLALVLPG